MKNSAISNLSAVVSNLNAKFNNSDTGYKKLVSHPEFRVFAKAIYDSKDAAFEDFYDFDSLIEDMEANPEDIKFAFTINGYSIEIRNKLLKLEGLRFNLDSPFDAIEYLTALEGFEKTTQQYMKLSNGGHPVIESYKVIESQLETIERLETELNFYMCQ